MLIFQKIIMIIASMVLAVQLLRVIGMKGTFREAIGTLALMLAVIDGWDWLTF